MFAIEKKLHIFVFAAIAVAIEIFMVISGADNEFKGYSFIFSFVIFFAFYAVLEYVLYGLIDSKFTPFFSLVPAVLFFMMFRINENWQEFAIAAVLAVVVRIGFDNIPKREDVIDILTLILDGAAIILRMYWNVYSQNNLVDKLVFVALVVLTFSAFQRFVWGKRKDAFPFYYFMLMGAVLLFLPMSDNPINWSKLESKLGNVTDAVGYYFTSAFGDEEYVAGYGSFNVTGASISNSSKLQLILDSAERPYFVYTDEESNKTMKVCRSLYLAGGKGVDKEQLITWLQFLYDNDIDKNSAAAFSQISKLDEEYVYLDTPDEIAPDNALIISNQDGQIDAETSDSKHKKGYRLKVKYLDIDYGSPYLMELYRSTLQKDSHKEKMSYEQASKYYSSLYNQELKDIVSQQEYEDYVNTDSIDNSYSDTAGATDRMKELANEISGVADNDYDKAKLIENYLRQYTYSKKAVGGYNKNSDMTTAQGMADIADRFLFDTKSGYCVHYTSSMVTLLRLSGIPARAVRGYRYVFPLEVQDKYMVEANCAHVWPEAYIENIGWVPFEPTSSYLGYEEYTWHRQGSMEAQKESLKALVPEIPEDESNLETEEENQGLQLLKIIGIVAFSLVILFTLIWDGIKVFRRLRYILASPDEKLKIDVETIKERLIKLSKETINDRGLLKDYLCIAPDVIRDDVDKCFDAYYRIIYSQKSGDITSQKEQDMARRIRELLTSKVAKNLF